MWNVQGGVFLQVYAFLLLFVRKSYHSWSKMMSSPKSLTVKNAVFKQKMRINHVKYGQIVQIYHFARFTSVFSFLLPFVNKNLSLMVKLISSSKSISVNTAVFKHKLKI